MSYGFPFLLRVNMEGPRDGRQMSCILRFDVGYFTRGDLLAGPFMAFFRQARRLRRSQRQMSLASFTRLHFWLQPSISG
jgi:hypothetical protein